MTEAENDIMNATFKAGECAGLLLKHRRTHPERVLHVYRLMAEVGQGGQKVMGMPDPQNEQTIEDIGRAIVNGENGVCNPGDTDWTYPFWKQGQASRIKQTQINELKSVLSDLAAAPDSREAHDAALRVLNAPLPRSIPG